MNILKLVILLWGVRVAAGSARPAFPAAARLLRRVRLSRARLAAMPVLLQDLERTLQLHWPGTKVAPFGAILAGLGIVGSDLDCFAKLPDRWPYHDGTIFEVQSVLDQYPHLFRRPIAVSIARMPHVRFVHTTTGLQCDVSFRHQAGVRNTALVRYLMRLDRRALDLTTIIKYWAKLHKPSGARRIMANYAMVSLAIFYLQQVSVLPSIALLQQNTEEIIVEQWNTGFNEIPYRTSNNDTLFQLLGGFFQYYEKFDFESTIVSVFAGAPIKRSIFKDVDTVPDTFSLYKRNLADRVEPLNINTAICVQDVFFHSLNVASDSRPEVLSKFKSYLRFAVEAFTKAKDDFLELILLPDEDFDVLDEQVNYWTNSTKNGCWKTCWKRQEKKDNR